MSTTYLLPVPIAIESLPLTLMGAIVDALTICSGVASTAPAGSAAAARREERVEREDEEEVEEAPPIPDDELLSISMGTNTNSNVG